MLLFCEYSNNELVLIKYNKKKTIFANIIILIQLFFNTKTRNKI